MNEAVRQLSFPRDFGYTVVCRIPFPNDLPMLDPNTFDARWTLLFGLPLIAWLGASAWRRSRAVAKRIRDVREEMARHPQDPYQALAGLMTEDDKNEKARRQ